MTANDRSSPQAAGSSGDQPRPAAKDMPPSGTHPRNGAAGRQGEYENMTLLNDPGGTEVARRVHGSCNQPATRHCTPSTWRGIAGEGPSRSSCPSRPRCPGVLRDPGQAGRLERDSDPGTPAAAGPGCRPGGAGRRPVPRGSRLRRPRGRGTRPRHPRYRTSRTGPALPRPGHHVWVEPGEIPAFRFPLMPK